MITPEELTNLAAMEGIDVCNQQTSLSSIDYTRPLSDYATPADIATHLQRREGSYHIYTESLRENGHVVKEEMSKYLAAKEYINSGTLKEAFKSPLHLFYAIESGCKERLEAYEKKKSCFVLGEYIHQAILEPTKFKRAVIEPKYNQSTKDGVRSLISFWEDKLSEQPDYQNRIETLRKEIDKIGYDLEKMEGLKTYLNALKETSGYQSVSEYDKQIIDIAYINFKRYGDGLLFDLLKHSKREISIYYDDPEYNIKQRIRPDAMQFSENIGHNTIISVKSTRAENIGQFAYQTAKLNYELTEGMYLEVATKVTGRDFNSVITIMVQTIPPYGIAVFVWDGEDLEIGKYKYYHALQTVAECREKKHYPGYDAFAEAGNHGLIAMKQPTWNAKELNPIEIDN